MDTYRPYEVIKDQWRNVFGYLTFSIKLEQTPSEYEIIEVAKADAQMYSEALVVQIKEEKHIQKLKREELSFTVSLIVDYTKKEKGAARKRVVIAPQLMGLFMGNGNIWVDSGGKFKFTSSNGGQGGRVGITFSMICVTVHCKQVLLALAQERRPNAREGHAMGHTGDAGGGGGVKVTPKSGGEVKITHKHTHSAHNTTNQVRKRKRGDSSSREKGLNLNLGHTGHSGHSGHVHSHANAKGKPYADAMTEKYKGLVGFTLVLCIRKLGVAKELVREIFPSQCVTRSVSVFDGTFGIVLDGLPIKVDQLLVEAADFDLLKLMMDVTLFDAHGSVVVFNSGFLHLVRNSLRKTIYSGSLLANSMRFQVRFSMRLAQDSTIVEAIEVVVPLGVLNTLKKRTFGELAALLAIEGPKR